MQEKYIVESWTVFDDIQLSISTRFKYIAGSRWFFLSIFYGFFFGVISKTQYLMSNDRQMQGHQIHVALEKQLHVYAKGVMFYGS